MTITTDPAAAAMQRLVDRINAGSGTAGYTLPAAATYTRESTEDIQDLDTLAVTVVQEFDADEDIDSIDYDNYSSHNLLVVFRKKLADKLNATLDPLCLIVAQVADWIDNSATDTSTIKVMEVRPDSKPDADQLRGRGVFLMAISIRVEVES